MSAKRQLLEEEETTTMVLSPPSKKMKKTIYVVQGDILDDSLQRNDTLFLIYCDNDNNSESTRIMKNILEKYSYVKREEIEEMRKMKKLVNMKFISERNNPVIVCFTTNPTTEDVNKNKIKIKDQVIFHCADSDSRIFSHVIANFIINFSKFYEKNKTIKQIIIPYLLCYDNLLQWNIEYLKKIENLSEILYNLFQVEFVVVIPKYWVWFLNKNSLINTVVQFDEVLKKEYMYYNSFNEFLNK